MSTPLKLMFTSQKARLTAAIAAIPLLAAKVQLYSNDLDPSPSNVLGDFTQCTFGGYTAGGNAVAWGAVGVDLNGVPVAPSNQTYTADGTGPAETAFGVLLVDSTGALVAAGRFDNPRTMIVNGDQLTCTLLFGLVDGSLTLAVGP